MKVLEAVFLTSAARAADVPQHAAPQIALVGRSNVGKSSLINALTRSAVARTSGAPGKTRLANLYRVTLSGSREPGAGSRKAQWALYLVDLPGYGYARAPRRARGALSGSKGGREDARAHFARLTAEYFGTIRPGPNAALLIVDARHPGLAPDLDAWDWIQSLGLASAVVATKIDKLGRAVRTRALGAIERALNSPVTAVSAATGEGMDQLWTRIATLVTPRRETAARP